MHVLCVPEGEGIMERIILKGEGNNMIASNAFDYINVLDKTADASWRRHELISNNIANQSTPGYKRQDIDFEGELQRALRYSKYTTIDEKVANLNYRHLEGRQYTDYGDFSYRMDENNVDPELEQVHLASNQIKYEGLINSLTAEFNNLKSVIK